MSRARFRRPDGRDGTYGQWMAEISARWNALPDAERAVSREAASARLAADIRAQDDGPTLMHLYDEIGWFGVQAADVVEALAGIKGDVEVHLNSPGGSIFDGLAIYATFRQHPGTVSMVVDGLAASAASFIAMAAAPGKLQVTPNGTMMIHEGSGICFGDAKDMADMAEVLDEASENIASIYAARAGKSAAEYRALMKAETWAVGKKAVALGLADSVRDLPDAPATAAARASALLPWQMTIVAGPAAPVPVIVNADGSHAPMKGDHSHSHPAFGSQGDDANHEHGHSHSNDASHDHSHAEPEPEPDGDEPQDALTADAVRALIREELRAALAAASGVDNSPWDASKAWHNGAESDDPAAFYEGICAGKKAGDKATQDAWALPYKYHPGDPPNADGVKAGLSRLPQTEGLTNEAEAKATLQAAMKKVNPDYEPDDRVQLHLDFSGVDLGQLGNDLTDALKGARA